MDASELAGKMLEWEKLRRELDALEAEIVSTVLEIGKTQTVGNVRASYSAGRKSYDYQAAADGHPDVTTAMLFTYTTRKVDWRGVCKHLEIAEIPFTQSAPTVSMKLL